MIVIVYGVPGSGKSYYVAYSLLKKGIVVFEDGIYRVADDYILFTNLDGLKVEGCYDWDELFNSGRWNDFRSYEVFKGKKLVFAIDEAQIYFHKLSQEELYFFQYHRHYGYDFILTTQNLSQLDNRLVGNAEYLIRALPKTDRVFGAFRYHLISSLDKSTVLKKFSLPASPEVFFLYKSFEDYAGNLAVSVLEGGSARKEALKGVVALAVALVLLFFVSSMFFRLPSVSAEKKEDKHRVENVEELRRSAVDVETYTFPNGNVKANKEVDGGVGF